MSQPESMHRSNLPKTLPAMSSPAKTTPPSTWSRRLAGAWPLALGLLFTVLLAVRAPVALAAAPLASSSGVGTAAQPLVYQLTLNDTIQPVSAEFLARGIAQASQAHANALVVCLNTPGGLLTSTRAMVHDILASPVPVVIYVSPNGSRAGSAGFFLLEAADVAAMAPGTNAGASHPILEGKTMGPILRQKITNDAMAFLRSYTTVRKRNAAAAEQAVLHSDSYTAQEALSLHLIEYVAPSISALLDQLNGQLLTRFNGQQIRLNTAHAQIVVVRPSVRERILDPLMNPNLAVLLLIAGALLLYLEFHLPGMIVPGALGMIMVLLALFALNMLPVNIYAWFFLFAALALLFLESKFPTYGLLALSGTALFIFGLLSLVNGPIAQLRVQGTTALGAGLAFGVITAILVRAAMQARRNKVLTGPEAMIGAVGTAQEPLEPRGQILVHGELWQAESAQQVAAGAQVKVTEVDGLTLKVVRFDS